MQNLTPLARILTENQTVYVATDGKNSNTDTTKVTLSSNLPPPAVQGVLDHELGHVMWSPRDGKEKIDRKLGKEAAILLNAIEDCRVNAKLLKKWKGSRNNLSRAAATSPINDSFLQQLTDFGKLTAGVYLKLFPVFRSGSADPTDLIKGYEDLIPPIRKLKTFRQSKQLTENIFQRWRELHPEEKKPPEEKPPGNKPRGDKPPENEPRKPEQEEEKELPKELFFLPLPPIPPKAREESPKEQEGQTLICSPILPNPQILEEHDDPQVYAIHEAAKTYIQNAETKTDNTPSPRLGVNAAKLALALSTELETLWTENRDRGKISTKNLYRLLLPTPDFNVFKKATKAEEINTAVSILLDVSGSMSSSAGFLQESFETLTLALDRLQIPSETLTFSTSGTHHHSQDHWYGRDIDMYIDILKTFNEPTRTGLNRQLTTQNGNPIGEAMQIAANRLLMRPERKKVLLVFTDGEPGNGGQSDHSKGYETQTRFTKQVSQSIIRAGITLLGIGLRLYNPEDFCIPISCNLSSSKDLVEQLGTNLLEHIRNKVVKKEVV